MIEIPQSVTDQIAATEAARSAQSAEIAARTQEIADSIVSSGVAEAGIVATVDTSAVNTERRGMFGAGVVENVNPGPRSIRQAAAMGTVEGVGAGYFVLPTSERPADK